MTLARELATVRSYEELHAVMRARADELAVTRETIDAVAGLQPGYAGKVLAPKPIKRLGPVTLPLMLGALGLALVVVEDESALVKVKPRLVKRSLPLMHSASVHVHFSRRFLRQIQRKGGANSRKNLSPKKRRALARRAARARWHKPPAAP